MLDRPLMEQIQSLFPDIQPADIHRVLDFLGYSTQDIQKFCAWQEIKGQVYFVQQAVFEAEIQAIGTDIEP